MSSNNASSSTSVGPSSTDYDLNSLVDDEPPTCPLCMEDLDETDRDFFPCPCDYQVCLWCLEYIKTNLGGKCPACRQQYDETKYRYVQSKPADGSFSRLLRGRNAKTAPKHGTNRRSEASSSSCSTATPATSSTTPATAHLASLKDIRVIQRNLCYVLGLPPNIARKEDLVRPEFFGRYGTISNIVVTRTQSNASVASYSAYVTYSKTQEAVDAIRDIDGTIYEGRVLRSSFGTTKYCSFFLRGVQCVKPDCFYLHHLGDQNDSFTREEMISSRTAFTDLPKNGAPPEALKSVYRLELKKLNEESEVVTSSPGVNKNSTTTTTTNRGPAESQFGQPVSNELLQQLQALANEEKKRSHAASSGVGEAVGHDSSTAETADGDVDGAHISSDGRRSAPSTAKKDWSMPAAASGGSQPSIKDGRRISLEVRKAVPAASSASVTTSSSSRPSARNPPQPKSSPTSLSDTFRAAASKASQLSQPPSSSPSTSDPSSTSSSVNPSEFPELGAKVSTVSKRAARKAATVSSSSAVGGNAWSRGKSSSTLFLQQSSNKLSSVDLPPIDDDEQQPQHLHEAGSKSLEVSSYVDHDASNAYHPDGSSAGSSRSLHNRHRHEGVGHEIWQKKQPKTTATTESNKRRHDDDEESSPVADSELFPSLHVASSTSPSSAKSQNAEDHFTESNESDTYQPSTSSSQTAKVNGREKLRDDYQSNNATDKEENGEKEENENHNNTETSMAATSSFRQDGSSTQGSRAEASNFPDVAVHSSPPTIPLPDLLLQVENIPALTAAKGPLISPQPQQQPLLLSPDTKNAADLFGYRASIQETASRMDGTGQHERNFLQEPWERSPPFPGITDDSIFSSLVLTDRLSDHRSSLSKGLVEAAGSYGGVGGNIGMQRSLLPHAPFSHQQQQQHQQQSNRLGGGPMDIRSTFNSRRDSSLNSGYHHYTDSSSVLGHISRELPFTHKIDGNIQQRTEPSSSSSTSSSPPLNLMGGPLMDRGRPTDRHLGITQSPRLGDRPRSNNPVEASLQSDEPTGPRPPTPYGLGGASLLDSHHYGDSYGVPGAFGGRRTLQGMDYQHPHQQPHDQPSDNVGGLSLTQLQAQARAFERQIDHQLQIKIEQYLLAGDVNAAARLDAERTTVTTALLRAKLTALISSAERQTAPPTLAQFPNQPSTQQQPVGGQGGRLLQPEYPTRHVVNPTHQPPFSNNDAMYNGSQGIRLPVDESLLIGDEESRADLATYQGSMLGRTLRSRYGMNGLQHSDQQSELARLRNNNNHLGLQQQGQQHQPGHKAPMHSSPPFPTSLLSPSSQQLNGYWHMGGSLQESNGRGGSGGGILDHSGLLRSDGALIGMGGNSSLDPRSLSERQTNSEAGLQLLRSILPNANITLAPMGGTNPLLAGFPNQQQQSPQQQSTPFNLNLPPKSDSTSLPTSPRPPLQQQTSPDWNPMGSSNQHQQNNNNSWQPFSDPTVRRHE